MQRILLLFLLIATAGSLSAQTEYRVGTGKAIVTDPACGLGMVGFADDKQKTNGIDLRLYARTFIVEHKATSKRVVFMNADLWALPHAVKRSVLLKLKQKYGATYTYDNCHFSATHTHSGPGGYSEYNLYNYTIGGFDQTNFNLIVNGIVRSIGYAHDRLADGNVYYGETTIDDCGRNRSVPAYNRNPLTEQQRYPYRFKTDNTLYLLKFTQLKSGRETPVGALSWYALHPTDRGQANTKISGDNKGYASSLLEKKYSKFTAAFANGSAGDVSGNVEFGKIPDGINDQRNVEKHGTQQANAAIRILNNRMTKLTGKIEYRHQFWDMSKRTRTPGGLGVSFGAGSSEDSDPGSGLKEGITVDDINNGTLAKSDKLIKDIADFGVRTVTTLSSTEDRAQFPKPVLVYTGKPSFKGASLTPNVLPFQIIQLGQIAITGIPAEINTMAGRRVQDKVKNNLSG
ncbi:MAG: neutral/alkaline non-lysosomal ceramidase N-terminal domain-containing protein, partial [Bacteroidota bacterium]